MMSPSFRATYGARAYHGAEQERGNCGRGSPEDLAAGVPQPEGDPGDDGVVGAQLAPRGVQGAFVEGGRRREGAGCVLEAGEADQRRALRLAQLLEGHERALV